MKMKSVLIFILILILLAMLLPVVLFAFQLFIGEMFEDTWLGEMIELM